MGFPPFISSPIHRSLDCADRQCGAGSDHSHTEYYMLLLLPRPFRLRRGACGELGKNLLSWAPQKGSGREICRHKGTPGRLCSPRKGTDPAARWGGMGTGRTPPSEGIGRRPSYSSTWALETSPSRGPPLHYEGSLTCVSQVVIPPLIAVELPACSFNRACIF